MDITVAAGGSEEDWTLTDLLNRSLGGIKRSEGGFTIYPDGPGIDAMAGIQAGPYKSLDDALAAIETRTRGACRRV